MGNLVIFCKSTKTRLFISINVLIKELTFFHFAEKIRDIRAKRQSMKTTTKTPIQAVSSWVRRQPPKVKAFLAVVTGMAALVLLRFIVHDHDNLFVAAEAVHSIGICVLIYKLMKEKTCAGIILYFLFTCLFSHPILGFFSTQFCPSASDRFYSSVLSKITCLCHNSFVYWSKSLSFDENFIVCHYYLLSENIILS